MSAYRSEIEVFPGAVRGSLGGGRRHLIRVRLFDELGCPDPLPDAHTDIDSTDARELAFQLLIVAEDADRLTRVNPETKR